MQFQLMEINTLCKIKEGAIGCIMDSTGKELTSEFFVKDRNMWGIIVEFLPSIYPSDFAKLKILGIDKAYYFNYNDFNILEENNEIYQSDEIRQLQEQARFMLCKQGQYSLP